MYTKVKRIMSMALALCMVFSMMPMTAFAASDGDTLTTNANTAPSAEAGFVWVAADPSTNYPGCGKDEHSHSADCFVCPHGNNHDLNTCYEKMLSVCEHADTDATDYVHLDVTTGESVNNTDAYKAVYDQAKANAANTQSATDTYQAAYNQAYADYNKGSEEYQIAYKAAKATEETKYYTPAYGATYDSERKKVYDKAYAEELGNKTGYLDKLAAGLAAEKAVVAALSDITAAAEAAGNKAVSENEETIDRAAEAACEYLLVKVAEAAGALAKENYCKEQATSTANATKFCYSRYLTCTHTDGHIAWGNEGTCYTQLKDCTEDKVHTHTVEACTSYNWILKEDANGNGTPDEQDPKWNVSFSLNGGQGAIESQTILDGMKATAVAEPERTYYQFAGWVYTAIENEIKVEKAFSFDTAIVQDYSLKATWTPINDADSDGIANEEETQYTVVYKSGYGEDDALATYTNQVEKMPTPTPANPSREGYNFGGWTPAVEAIIDTEIAMNNVITYTATWNQLCNVFFMVDGQQYVDTVSVEAGTVISAPTTDPCKSENYTFAGWFEKDAETAFDFTTAISTNVTLYAKFTPNNDSNTNGIADEEEMTYIVTYTDGVEEAERFPDQVSEGILPGLDTPTYTPNVSGYKFVKWEPVWAAKVPTEAATEETRNITYTAVWAADVNNNGVADENETMAIKVEGNGSVTVNGNTVANYVYDSLNGETITFVATPEETTYVSDIQVGGESLVLESANYDENRSYTHSITIQGSDISTQDISSDVNYDVSVTFSDAAFTKKAQPHLAYEDGKTYTAKELYEAAIEAPAYDDSAEIDVVAYLARPAMTLTATIPSFDVPFIGSVGGNTFELPLSAVWAEVGTAYEYVDPQTLMDNAIAAIQKNINEQNWMGAYKAVQNLSNLASQAGTVGCHAFGYDDGTNVNGEEILHVTYKTSAVAIDDENVPVWVKDNRIATTLNIPAAELTYDSGRTTATLINELTLESNATGGSYTIVESMDSMDVGEYTLTVKYSGSESHKPTTATAVVKIVPAPASANVPFNYVIYGNNDYTKYTITSGEKDVTSNADHVVFIAGMDLNDQATSLQLILPEKYNDLTNQLGLSFTVAQVLNGLNELAGAVDEATLNEIKSAVSQIPGIDQITNAQVTLGGSYPTNAGTYMVGVVTIDPNYETAYGTNLLVIQPDGIKAEIAWDVEDENGVYTLEKIQDGSHELGAHVESVDEPGNKESAEEVLAVKFMGVDISGNPVIIDINEAQEKLTIGAYTEVAYFENLGNTMYYDDPIMRPIVIISDLVEVKLYDENGVENYDYLATYDKEPHAMTAKAFKRGTDVELGEAIVNYTGVASDGTIYNSTTAPTTTGTYTVTATFSQDENNDGTPEYVGAGAAVMVIQPATASIGVADLTTATYPETISISQVVGQPSDSDAKYAVMVAGISDVGDFSEDGLAAVEGVVLVDFPDRVDVVLNSVLGQTEFTVDSFKAVLTPLAAALESAGIDTSEYSDILDQIAALPGNVTIKLAELGNYTFQNPGVWVVVAGIMDNNYIPTVDMGLVVIAPDATQYVLEWNYTDDNGVITRPVLEGVDLLAHADDAESKENSGVTDMIKYVVYGFTVEGQEVRIYGAEADIADQIKNLENGVYTQVAYIPANISANIPYAEPISRQIILTSQYVIVTAPEETFAYTGSPVDYKVTVKYVDESEATKGELTVNYVGVNGTDGTYNSTEVPTNVGIYAVTAEYRELDENGELKYFGMDLGSITITPAELVYDIKDAEYVYDGTPKAPVIEKTAGTHDIVFIVDPANKTVNVIAPSVTDTGDWDGDLSIQYWVEQLNNALNQLTGSDAKTILTDLVNKLPDEAKNNEKFNALLNVLTTVESDKLILNGAYPTELGEYPVYGIAFKGANHMIALSEGSININDHEHNMVLNTEKSYDPTCEDDGLKYWECNVNGCDHYEEETINALGHDFEGADWQQTKDGHYQICQRENCYAQTKLAEHGNWSNWIHTDPAKHPSHVKHTCGTCGYTAEGEHALKCVEILGDDKYHSIVCNDKDCNQYGMELTQAKHNYGKWIRVKTPTETEKGLKYRECECCGHRQWKQISMVFNASTGDTIMIAVGVMVASAAALTILLIRKKKSAY